MPEQKLRRMRQCPKCGKLNPLNQATCSGHGCHENLVISGILVDVDEKGNIYPVNMENTNAPFDIVVESAEEKMPETDQSIVEKPLPEKKEKPSLEDKKAPTPTSKELKQMMKAQKKEEKRARKGKRSTGQKLARWVLCLLLIAGIGVGGYFAYDYWQGQQEKEDRTTVRSNDDETEEDSDTHDDRTQPEETNSEDNVETWTDANGTTFTGSRVNGKLEGSGKAVYAEGDTYEGEFVSGYRQGKGEYHWVDGDRYVGSWDNGVISGYGVYWWTSGNRYVGYWENNMKNGIGTLYYADGTIEYGRWLDDELVEVMEQE